MKGREQMLWDVYNRYIVRNMLKRLLQLWYFIIIVLFGTEQDLNNN